MKNAFTFGVLALLMLNCSSGGDDDDSSGAGAGGTGSQYICAPTVTTSEQQRVCQGCLIASCCDELGACEASADCSSCLSSSGEQCTPSGSEGFQKFMDCADSNCAAECNGGSGGSAGTRCTSAVFCPSGDDCCIMQADGSGLCGKSSDGLACLCETAVQCTSGACAPRDTPVGPVGPTICVKNDGAHYDGCNAGVACRNPGDVCTYEWDPNTSFCATPCDADSDCGAATCVTPATLDPAVPNFCGPAN